MKHDNYDDVEWMRSQMDDRIRTGMNNNGFELLTWADVGWVHHFSTEPVVYPEDLKELKMLIARLGFMKEILIMGFKLMEQLVGKNLVLLVSMKVNLKIIK